MQNNDEAEGQGNMRRAPRDEVGLLTKSLRIQTTFAEKEDQISILLRMWHIYHQLEAHHETVMQRLTSMDCVIKLM